MSQLGSLDVIQRKMLRNMVGWTRYETEQWSDTMRRMREKVHSALQIFPIDNWTEQLMRRQFRMVCRFSQINEWAMRVSRWHPPSFYMSAHRNRGRPSHRWDNLLNDFVGTVFNHSNWQDAIEDMHVDFPTHENNCVSYVQTII